MDISAEASEVVRQALEVVPLVMRALALEMRQTRPALRPGHFRLLAMLAVRQHNLSELAERHSVSLPTMSRSVTALVERGWVRRTRDPTDRRMVLIELTPAGRAVLDRMRSEAEARLTECFASLSPQECDQLLAGLAVLRAVFAHAENGARASG